MLRIGALLFALGVIGLWQWIAAAGVFPPVFLPSPAETWQALRAIEARGELWNGLAATCLRMLYGWGLASVAGIVLGGVLARSGAVRAYIQPTLEFLRPLPAAAIIPPAVLLLGLTPQMAVSVIAFGALWPVLLGSYYGFSNVEPRIAEVAALQELGTADYLRKVALPSALPEIFAGLRINLAIALILAVVVEIQAGLSGLGFNIMLAQRLFRTPELYAGIVVLGAIGAIASQGLALVERRLLRWRTLTR
jgi:ABC-type nitrate/sulfonate/bicarbonate transport system permease component